MASNEEANTNMRPVVADDYDDCFDLSFLFQDDHYEDQSLPEINNNMMTMSSAAEPILDTNMSCMNVTPAAYHQDNIVSSNNKRIRDDQEEAISPLKRFKPLETLENPNHLLHQETTHAYSNPSPSVQPYIVNNFTSDHIFSGCTVVGFRPTNMGGDPITMAIFGGSRRKTPSPWTIEEHVRFLVGIAQGYRGHWNTMSRVYVRTRTAAQVTSHAQKHFLHQQKTNNYNNVNGSANPANTMMTKRRRSIYDIASLADVEVSKVADALRYVRSPINHDPNTRAASVGIIH